MKMKVKLLVFGIFVLVFSLFIETNSFIDRRFEDSFLTTTELIQKYGYKSQTHLIPTADGYILEVHRILKRPSKAKATKNNAVLLMHGLQSSSSDWVIMGPKQGLGYYLSDLGYDVWMGNFRGNRYSRNNTRLHTSQTEFWKFSWHEMGIYDIPAIIDYILRKTGTSKISYIGFSQGSTSFFVMASEKTEYLRKVSNMQALSPVAFIKNTKSPFFGLGSLFAAYFDLRSKYVGPYEYFRNRKELKVIAQILCPNPVTYKFCRQIYYWVGGSGTKQLNETALPVLLSHFPSGSSSMQFAHYGQCIASGRFHQFDFGQEQNKLRYGSISPPDYNFTRLTIPVALHYADNDDISVPIDVMETVKRTPNLIGAYRVSENLFNHMDFLYGIDARELVYDRVVNIIKEYS